MVLREDNLPQDYIDLLRALAEHHSQSRIAEIFQQSRQNIIKKINKLIDLGLVVKFTQSSNGVTYHLQEGAQRYLPEGNSEKVTPSDQEGPRKVTPSETRVLRGHDYSIRYPFEQKLKANAPAVVHFKDYKVTINDRIVNWTKATIKFRDYRRLTFTAIVSPSSLIITGFEIRVSYMADLEQAEAEVLGQLEDIIRGIEVKLQEQIPGLRIKRKNGLLVGKIKTREWAFERHPVAMETGERKAKFEVIDEEEHLRADVDFSKGFPELETHYAPESTGDMSRMVDFTRDVILDKFKGREVLKDLGDLKGDLTLLRDATANLARASTNIVKQQEYENQFFRKHNALIEKINILIDNLNARFGGDTF